MEEIQAKRFDQVTDRKCGSCTACCTWLGITELKKKTAEKCKHLRSPAHIHKRCGIYSSRPSACSAYECLWKAGWGEDAWQPHKSGILITAYPVDDDPETMTITMNVFDMVKSKPYVTVISSQLIMLPMVTELRIINIKDKKALLYKNGKIYSCRILPGEGIEDLLFAAEDKPVGSYDIVSRS